MDEAETSPSADDEGAAASRISAVFLIEAAPGADALIRVLSPFAAIGADIASVASAASSLSERGCATIRIEAARMEAPHAERVARKLRTLLCVKSVGLILRCVTMEATAHN